MAREGRAAKRMPEKGDRNVADHFHDALTNVLWPLVAQNNSLAKRRSRFDGIFIVVSHRFENTIVRVRATRPRPNSNERENCRTWWQIISEDGKSFPKNPLSFDFVRIPERGVPLVLSAVLSSFRKRRNVCHDFPARDSLAPCMPALPCRMVSSGNRFLL